MRFSIKGLILFTAAIAFLVWHIWPIHIELTRCDTAENVATVDWLPDTASNISYCKTYLNTAYEFDMTESEFLAWSEWDVNEIGQPVSITRYKRYAREIARHTAEYDEQWAEIDDGLYYGKKRSNGGGVWVGYDRKQGRVFYTSSAR